MNIFAINIVRAAMHSSSQRPSILMLNKNDLDSIEFQDSFQLCLPMTYDG
jgi:hypothetical protein